jgi:carbon-monoxide dehydrogenase large subunit
MGDDFENLINPLRVEGPVHDGGDQRLTASFMDYAMPRADDMPMFGLAAEAVPASADAVVDALWQAGGRSRRTEYG